MASPSHYPIPADEEQRLRDLERHGVFGLSADEHFDRIVELASSALDTPIAVISLVEADRQWFLAHRGLDVSETPRDVSFCTHAILDNEVMVVPDATADERFRDNPFVTQDPRIRFYAGAPLHSPDGHNLGTLCVIDTQPRHPTDKQLHQLRLLADLVMRELELRRSASLCPITGLPNRFTFLAIAAKEFERARLEGHPVSLLFFDIDNFRQINHRWGHASGDTVLLDLTRLANTFLQEEDFAARLGDGEFGLLLVNVHPDRAMALAESLRQAATQMRGVYSHSDFHLHISGGLTTMAPGDRNFSDLAQRADRALEVAKANGRNQIASLFGG